jgi:hypothetical protein
MTVMAALHAAAMNGSGSGPEGFQVWRDRLDRLVRERLGTTLDAVPHLLLNLGYQAGDSPGQFFAECIEGDIRNLESRREP